MRQLNITKTLTPAEGAEALRRLEQNLKYSAFATFMTRPRRYMLEQSPTGDLTCSYSERTFQRDLPLIAETTGFTIKARRVAYPWPNLL